MFGSYVGMLLLAGECAGSIVPETPCQLVGGTSGGYAHVGSTYTEVYCDGFQDGSHLGNPPTPAELCDPSKEEYPCCTRLISPVQPDFNMHICYSSCTSSLAGGGFGPTMESFEGTFGGATEYTLNCALYEPPPAPPPPAPGPESGGLSGGEIAGIVVGSVAGVVLISVAVSKSGFFRGRRTTDVPLVGGLIDGF